MSDNLKQKTLKSMKWLAVDKFGQQAIQMFIGIILARTLLKSDFGLIAVIAVFVGLGFVLVESGFSQSLIKKENTDEVDYNSVFYFNLVVALVVYVLLFLFAPLIASFFKQPALVDISRVLFLVIPINSLYIVPFAQLNKEMNFKAMTIANILGIFVGGGVGVVLALTGFGVWALVVQQVLAQLTRVIVYYFTVKWRPQLIFSFDVIRSFWSFSVHLLFTAILNVLFYNIFNFVFGRYYSLRQTGEYYQANKLNETANQSLLVILTGSSFTLFSKLQTNVSRLQNTYRSIAQKSSIITFPAMLLLVAIAEPLFFTLYGQKWLEAVPYFQLLAIASVFAVLFQLSIHLLNARGKSKTTFRIELFRKLLILMGVFVGFRISELAMLVGYVFANFISYIIIMFLLKVEINHYIRHQILDFIQPLVFGLLAAFSCYLLSLFVDNYYLLLCLQLLLFGTMYLAWLYFFNRMIFNQLKLRITNVLS